MNTKLTELTLTINKFNKKFELTVDNSEQCELNEIKSDTKKIFIKQLDILSAKEYLYGVIRDKDFVEIIINTNEINNYPFVTKINESIFEGRYIRFNNRMLIKKYCAIITMERFNKINKILSKLFLDIPEYETEEK